MPVREEAFRRGHRFGNRLLTAAICGIFTSRFSDVLSGYKVMSRRFVKSFPALASGFETETELVVHALELRMQVAEVEVSYRERPQGSARDGVRIAKTIVGLVRDTVNRGWTAEVLPEIYIPYTITAMPDRLVVLTQADPNSLTNAVRAQVYAIDQDQPVTDVKTIDRFLDEWVYSGPRFTMVLFGMFAAFGLALATVGVYGILSSWVAQQTQEIGVRMALGAGFGDVLRIVLGRGLRLLGCGIALGLAGSLASVRLLRQAIFNVSPFDPVAFTVVSLLLLLVGIQACFWPARRAARIDPSTALRYE